MELDESALDTYLFKNENKNGFKMLQTIINVETLRETLFLLTNIFNQLSWDFFTQKSRIPARLQVPALLIALSFSLI